MIQKRFTKNSQLAMALLLYNTLTKKKQPFIPIDPTRVTMYVCGPTVYDYVHIGNARPAVVFDVLFRLLSHLYPKVVYARNITDIDDKIIQAAEKAKTTIQAITSRYTKAYQQDMTALGVLKPTIEPFATDHIQPMQQMIGQLIDQGHAYVSAGHILFRIASMPAYGQLSGRSEKDQLAGARIAVADYKKDPNDFILWKPSSSNQPGWDSPWGRGRPGWHLECSAMVNTHLGKIIDIHGGGQDLIFPHHENEIAQSCCAHQTKDYVHYWLHNGYLTIDGEKMSKSLGNFLTLHDALGQAPGECLRYALLSTQYRQTLDWTKSILKQASTSMDRLYSTLRSVQDIQPEHTDMPVRSALEDDLNTPVALAGLHSLATQLNKTTDPHLQANLKGKLLQSGAIMGLLLQDPEAWFRWQPAIADGLDDDTIEQLIAKRQLARKNKDFQHADQIRKQLAKVGIIVEDQDQHTHWRRNHSS